MEAKINKTDYKFLKYKAVFESKFITLSNKFKIPKNELLGAMIVYFDKTNRDPRELNFDNSMERVIKILNKNERDYLKPIYAYLLDSAVQRDDTIQLLEVLINREVPMKSMSFIENIENHAKGDNEKLDQLLPIDAKDKITHLFMSFANEITKANEFEKRDVFNQYQEKLNQLF